MTVDHDTAQSRNVACRLQLPERDSLHRIAMYFAYKFTALLKVLSSEMDPAEIRPIR
jgi:hypothetical protein